MDAILAVLELIFWVCCVCQKPQPPAPARPDDWTPPTTEEIARVVGWPRANPSPNDPLYDRELDG